MPKGTLLEPKPAFPDVEAASEQSRKSNECKEMLGHLLALATWFGNNDMKTEDKICQALRNSVTEKMDEIIGWQGGG